MVFHKKACEGEHARPFISVHKRMVYNEALCQRRRFFKNSRVWSFTSEGFETAGQSLILIILSL